MRISIVELLLRILAIVFPLAGLALAITTKQRTFVGVVTYHYSSSFKYELIYRYLVGVDLVTSALSVVGLAFVCFLGSARKSFNLFLFDLKPLHSQVGEDTRPFLVEFVGLNPLTMMLMISACSSAATIGLVSRHGDMMGIWRPLCPLVGSFCKKFSMSIFCSFASFFTSLSLTILSARHLVTKHLK
ncbi:hypothetical protein ACFE04_005435 [Oxalis oulophora]